MSSNCISNERKIPVGPALLLLLLLLLRLVVIVVILSAAVVAVVVVVVAADESRSKSPSPQSSTRAELSCYYYAISTPTVCHERERDGDEVVYAVVGLYYGCGVHLQKLSVLLSLVSSTTR